MKKLLLAAALLGSLMSDAQTSWAPAGERIKTRWAAEVDPAAPLPEYPRPILVREQWMNLNGLWNYSLTSAGAARPGETLGEILVPFPIESALSGVQRRVSEKEALWYETTFEVPAAWRKGNDILLHFGAVDWKTEVYVNDLMVGSHTGGYTPFTFDITPALTAKGAQKLTVKVTDPTDKGYQPRGKQVNKPHGIWYTPVTGIWQTVWLEPVPVQNHIERIATASDIHENVLRGGSRATRGAATFSPGASPRGAALRDNLYVWRCRMPVCGVPTIPICMTLSLRWSVTGRRSTVQRRMRRCGRSDANATPSVSSA